MLALKKFAGITCIRNCRDSFECRTSDFSLCPQRKNAEQEIACIFAKHVGGTFADRPLDSFVNVIVTFATVLPCLSDEFI